VTHFLLRPRVRHHSDVPASITRQDRTGSPEPAPGLIE
jgi:hypothetical protein